MYESLHVAINDIDFKFGMHAPRDSPDMTLMASFIRQSSSTSLRSCVSCTGWRLLPSFRHLL